MHSLSKLVTLFCFFCCSSLPLAEPHHPLGRPSTLQRHSPQISSPLLSGLPVWHTCSKPRAKEKPLCACVRACVRVCVWQKQAKQNTKTKGHAPLSSALFLRVLYLPCLWFLLDLCASVVIGNDPYHKRERECVCVCV